MSKLLSQVEKLETFTEYSHAVALDVSSWTVGQQISHCCLVLRNVTMLLRRSGPEPEEPKLTRFGEMVFEAGQIPRGRGKAPASVVPEIGPSAHELSEQLAKARKANATLAGLPEEATFEHPYFGVLDKRHSVRFLEIHTDHHIRIIEDIRRKSEVND